MLCFREVFTTNISFAGGPSLAGPSRRRGPATASFPGRPWKAALLDMLQALNPGHANSPRDILRRLETMVLMSGMELPVRAIREQISSAIDLIVQQSRFKDGNRKVTHITEVQGMEGEIITLQDIFLFKPRGSDSKGRVLGENDLI